MRYFDSEFLDTLKYQIHRIENKNRVVINEFLIINTDEEGLKHLLEKSKKRVKISENNYKIVCDELSFLMKDFNINLSRKE